MKKTFFILLIAICTTANAQYTMLTEFTADSAFAGANPAKEQNLISVGGALYGMTTFGGTNGMGVIFKIMPDGTGYVKLLDFAGAANGRYPYGSLFSDGTFLYGMTYYGGANDLGVVFKIMPDGTGYAKLLDFAGASNGRNPYGSLISDGNFLYGMTVGGGINDMGVVFKIMPDGTGYSRLLDFAGVANGRTPYGSLVSDGTFLYGMTNEGGINNFGVVFKIMPDGTGYSKLLDFAGSSNGRTPYGSLISDGTFLYGMTFRGGTYGAGVIFKIMPDGTGYSKLLDFSSSANGLYPYGSLVSDGTFLYGMTSGGGTNFMGAVFKIMPDGTGFLKLLNFAGAANGRRPFGSLISDGTFLYGMACLGGINDLGVVFKIMPDGTGYSKLFDFAGVTNGSNPNGPLVSDGTFLYGMTYGGGTNDLGVVFKIMPDGTGYSKLLDFTGANGSKPNGSLIFDGTFLYGMTRYGGTNDLGVVFKIMPDGTGYTKLLDFAGASNGSQPFGSLFSDGTFLYGMTNEGGTNNIGVIFKIMHDGTGYSKLLDFVLISSGRKPEGSLISDGTFLYGMTTSGGANLKGVVFKIMPDGTGFSKLHDFAGAANGNGSNPHGSLVSDGTFLYGTTFYSGINNMGVIFKIMPDGTGYTDLHDFTGAANGWGPWGSLVSDGTFLYGMTGYGGTNDMGVVFKIMSDGTGYSKLLDFAGAANGSYPTDSFVSDGNFLYGVTNGGGALDFGTIFRYCLTMPAVNLVLSTDTVCINTNTYALTGGSPTGGSYSGPGVSAGNFDPGVAGVGLHNIIYTYADSNNCSNSDTVQLFVDVCTAIHTTSANQTFSIFPNPSKGIFTLVFAGETKQSQIEIYNVLGEKMIQRVVPGGAVNLEIDLSDHPNGIYSLQIKTEQGEVVGNKKIIISK